MRQLTKQEKLKHLEKEFNRMDVDNDGAIQYQELQYHLDQKNNGHPFDRTIANQLYNSIDKTEDGLITKKEFIGAWMDSENRIKERIDKNNNEIAKARKLKEENVS